MDDVKGFLQSKTIWGGVLAVAAPIAAHVFHITITDLDTQQIAETISGIVAAVGGVIAIFGRIIATKQIG